MIYQTARYIGAMAAVLEGKVDGIVLTGGLCRFDDVVNSIKKHCEWIAPVSVYPGEFEHETMARGALMVLTGREKMKDYPGRPVWEKFDDRSE